MQIFRDYEGREIRLTDERLQHIARGHSDVLRIENAIQDTLSNPDLVIPYEGDDETLNYCRWYPGVHTGFWVIVGVAIQENDAFILTAFTASRLELDWKKERRL